MIELNSLLAEATQKNASDIHLVVGEPPVFRMNGPVLERQTHLPALDEEAIQSILLPVLPVLSRTAFEEGMTNFADVTLPVGSLEYRITVFRERGRIAATIRVILAFIPSIEQIGEAATPILQDLATKTRGLILFTGPTGSGKATTAAAIIERINEKEARRIFVIDESRSYTFRSQESLITTLQVGQDIMSVEEGLRVVNNADADVIITMILPTQEAIRSALTLADTGRLVIAVLHGESVAEALQDLLSTFPEPREAWRSLLARTLVAAFNQRLLPRADRPGRAPAYEVLLPSPEVREVIRRGGELGEGLKAAMAAGHVEGMRTQEKAIDALLAAGIISAETAETYRVDRVRSATYADVLKGAAS
jgi:twitching motility protein PilT